MLTVFFGNDVVQVRKRAFDFLHSLESPDTLVTKITSDEFSSGMLPDLTQGGSLFGGTQIFVMDTISESGEEAFKEVIESLEEMNHSTNQFILIESALTVPVKKKIEAKSMKVVEVAEVKKEKFNAFLMTDALLRRDKKSLWLLLQEAWGNGLSNEEIIGVLFWQMKILRLVEKTKSAEEAGQKPFVYDKAKRALKNFKEGELEKISEGLLVAYHDGHLGKFDTSLGLERWALTL